MAIPDSWRNVFEPGSERVPFWTMAVATLRGRIAGRGAGLAREHRSGGPDYLHVSVDCPVAGLFRMTPQHGGVAPDMPLASTGQDLPVGDEELDAAYRFWSDDPDRLLLLVRQAGVKPALGQAATMVGPGFCFLTIRGGEAKASFDLRGTACDADRIRATLTALATVAAAAEGTWPPDGRNWAMWRFWNGGGALLVLVPAIAALVLGLLWLALG
jgi:hypothetical protein